MNKKVRKIAVCCAVGSLALMGRAKTAYAAGEPVAGITVLINDISEDPKMIEMIIFFIL